MNSTHPRTPAVRFTRQRSDGGLPEPPLTLSEYADLLHTRTQLAPLPTFMELVKKWSTRGYRSPCGRMWRLPTFTLGNRRYVTPATAEEFAALFLLTHDATPDGCACPACTRCEANHLELAHGEYPPPDGLPAMSYREAYRLLLAKLREQQEQADPTSPATDTPRGE